MPAQSCDCEVVLKGYSKLVTLGKVSEADM